MSILTGLSTCGGSPEAHRITILRESKLDEKEKTAKRLAGVKSE
jgi:4-hydroxybutyryl-CoA dehydratase/vinylacetyl-CoA-Delta-isomerase